jgi:hypothetical protein
MIFRLLRIFHDVTSPRPRCRQTNQLTSARGVGFFSHQQSWAKQVLKAQTYQTLLDVRQTKIRISAFECFVDI